VDESKRNLANEELSDTSLSKDFLNTVFPSVISFPEDAPNYEQTLNSQNNYNLTVNLNGDGQKPSKQEVNNVVNNIVKNEIINTPEDLKKNLQDNSKQKDGSSKSETVVIKDTKPTDQSTQQIVDTEIQTVDESNPELGLDSEQVSDTIGIEITPPFEPFFVPPPLTFDLDTFGETEPSAYTSSNKIDKGTSSITYQTVKNIIERSILPVSSGGIGKSILSDEYNSQISYVENLVNIQQPENETFNKVAEQSKAQELQKISREEDNQNNLKDIKTNIAAQNKPEQMKEMRGASSVPPVQMRELVDSNFKIYSGENTIGLFSREKNSPPGWRTVTS